MKCSELFGGGIWHVASRGDSFDERVIYEEGQDVGTHHHVSVGFGLFGGVHGLHVG